MAREEDWTIERVTVIRKLWCWMKEAVEEKDLDLVREIREELEELDGI